MYGHRSVTDGDNTTTTTEDGISGWRQVADHMWNNLANAAVAFAVASAAKEGEGGGNSESGGSGAESTDLWKEIALLATDLALSARLIHEGHLSKYSEGSSPPFFCDLIIDLHLNVLVVMEALGHLLPDSYGAMLRQRVDVIRQALQTLPSPLENVPPSYDAFQAD
ncbi:hypothetical protein R5R35_014089 [Gryllus longicercus]|uniref:Uncharacterized protein n=1 Tax=Gryllus longicercus TaxID=2509291 RepID=A0AAN9VZF9_9ORTH